MRRLLPVLLALGAATASMPAACSSPAEKKLPPLAMLSHQVRITIEDQVAVTRVEQTFRNHTPRQLEATYVFPVPKGASVQKFAMWVNGKEMPGELVEAAKARKIYTDIVRRTRIPVCWSTSAMTCCNCASSRCRPDKDQKIAISYTSVAVADAGVIEYVYPLKTDAKAASTLEKFSIKVHLKSQHPLQNIYSPTPSDYHDAAQRPRSQDRFREKPSSARPRLPTVLHGRRQSQGHRVDRVHASARGRQ